MGLFNFSTPNVRTFDHKPIYWDPIKEEQQEREKRIRAELGLADGDFSRSSIESRIKGSMRKGAKGMFDVKTKANRSSNKRLLIIVVLLSALFYFLLKF